jgi:catechol 2,3-dioxygenase-like lactoylglutathione lyase family enzyme
MKRPLTLPSPLRGEEEGEGQSGEVAMTQTPFKLIACLVISLAFITTASLAQHANGVPTVVQSIAAVGFTVSDMERSVAFYRDALAFKPVSDVEVDGPEYDQLYGVFGVRARIVRMQLGEQQMVFPDPRTRTVARNPVRTLEIEESASRPDDYEFSVAFDGRYYSIRKYPVSQGMVPSWNQEAFAVLSNLFQMTVTDLTKYPTPAIAIAK